MKIVKKTIKTKAGIPRRFQLARLKELEELQRCSWDLAGRLLPLFEALPENETVLPENQSALQNDIVAVINGLRSKVHEQAPEQDLGLLHGRIEPQDDDWKGEHVDQVGVYLVYGDYGFV